MKKNIAITLAFLLCSSLNAQTVYNKGKAIIAGNLNTENDTIYVTYYPYKLGTSTLGGITTTYYTTDGTFKAVLPVFDHPYYCSVKSEKWPSLDFTDQLIEPGDSLMISNNLSEIQKATNANNESIKITGYNAAKNKLIQDWNNARLKRKIPGIVLSVYGRYKSFRDEINVVAKRQTIYTRYLDSLIAAETSPISDTVKKMLYTDLKSRELMNILSVYRALRDKFIKEDSTGLSLAQLTTEYKAIINPMIQQFNNSNDFGIISPVYLEMAINKSIIDARISAGNQSVVPVNKYLEVVKQFPSRHKEVILTALLADFYRTSEENIPTVLTTIAPVIKNPELKPIISHFEQTLSTGMPVLPFTLTGLSGEKIDITHFKDKTVVIDFWFTGCQACVLLSRALKIVRERIGDRKDIVFMSVCIDKDRALWLNSVEKGIYTHPDFINTYTNGEGENHPLIKNYGIRGYPWLMIIGKENKLVTSNASFGKTPNWINELAQTISSGTNK